MTVNCLNPGFVATNLARDESSMMRLFVRLLAASPEKGAATSIYLASSADVQGVSGTYWSHGKEARSSQFTYDVAASQRLWEASIELIRF